MISCGICENESDEEGWCVYHANEIIRPLAIYWPKELEEAIDIVKREHLLEAAK